MNINTMRTSLLGVAMTLLAATPVLAADTIKIALIDPLSGPFANAGETGLKYLRYEADKFNARGGVLGKKIEIVGFDNKMSAQESLVALQTVINQKIAYVAQGNGSSVAAALIEGIAKHNARNPDNRIPSRTRPRKTRRSTTKNATSGTSVSSPTAIRGWKRSPTTSRTRSRSRRSICSTRTTSTATRSPRPPANRPRCQAARYQDRRRGPGCSGQGQGLLPVCRQDQGRGCRHGDHG